PCRHARRNHVPLARAASHGRLRADVGRMAEKGLSMRMLRLAVTLACLGGTVTADAGLAPTKASQLVTLVAGGGCPVTGHRNGTALAFRVGGDGVTTPLTIPPKQVLVLTNVVGTTFFQLPGDTFQASIIVGAGSVGSFAALRYETANASGALSV